ncbi:hypothetical protein H0O03_00230 [Candidatus Micrarchaeota archaeon]|nr:hypothetical protein [Candidatus Micrarchaeota archaeon]
MSFLTPYFPELLAFLFAIALLGGVYWFFRAFKDSSLAKPLIVIDVGLLAFAVHSGLELLGVLYAANAEAYSAYSDLMQIIAYLLILAGVVLAWKAFKSFDWLKELARH